MTRLPYSIRPFRESDLERILEITGESFDGASIEQRIDRLLPRARPSIDWTEQKRREVTEDVRRHAEGCFVAEVAGTVVGYATTSIRRDRLQGRIPNLAIDLSFRNQGIGRALIFRALEDFRGRGLRLARIETLADNAVGNHLYTSSGFREVVRQVHFALELD